MKQPYTVYVLIFIGAILLAAFMMHFTSLDYGIDALHLEIAEIVHRSWRP